MDGRPTSDESIARCISVIKSWLRAACPGADALIRNEYGRGYRFVGQVARRHAEPCECELQALIDASPDLIALKDGELYPEWLDISLVRDSSGRITHHLGIFSDITRHKETERRLQFMASHDPLTRLPNRLLLRDRFELAAAGALPSPTAGWNRPGWSWN